MRKRALVCLLVLIAVAGVTPARAGLTRISGKVTDEQGIPLEGICVLATPERLGEYAFTRTGAMGSYILEVRPGTYYVSFEDCFDQNYKMEWYNEAESWENAELVLVLLGQRKKINATLAKRGSISGTVRMPDGSPLGQVCVGAETPDFSQWGSAMSDPAGRYSILGLGSGDYRVSFRDCVRDNSIFASEYYEDASTRAEATLVPVVDGVDTPGIDATLNIGGSITGALLDANGDPASNICIEAFSEDNGFSTGLVATGSYELRGLGSGRYAVLFQDCGGGDRYRHQWYDRVTERDDATLVTVTLEATTPGIDARLDAL